MIKVKILTPQEMNRCDSYTIEMGISSTVLMERAAHSVVHAIVDEKGFIPKRTLIVCGKGNNAGDGLCIARELSDLSSECTILMALGLEGLSVETQRQFNLLQGKRCAITTDFKALAQTLDKYDLIVDSLFGTGLTRPISEELDEFLEKLNKARAFKCAVDVPTGINATNGSLFAGNPFLADLTVTFAFPKSGMFFYPARAAIGKLKCSYIGISNETPEKIGWSEKYLMNSQTAKSILPQSNPDAHKTTLGRLCVIGGSDKYKGAPMLALKGALKTGVGMLTGIIPRYSSQLPFHIPPEIIIDDTCSSKNFHRFESLRDILSQSDEFDAFVIGPGMGRSYSTGEFIRDFVLKTQKPLLIDADALYAFSSQQALDLLANKAGQTVLTPHMGEFSRLTGLSVDEIKHDRCHILSAFSKRHDCTVVLKDSTTLISTQSGQIIFNTTGNEALATGGSGDVLSGIIGGFLAQGVQAHRAAQLGVYLHGLSADLYKKEHDSATFTPSMISEWLSEAMASIK